MSQVPKDPMYVFEGLNQTIQYDKGPGVSTFAMLSRAKKLNCKVFVSQSFIG